MAWFSNRKADEDARMREEPVPSKSDLGRGNLGMAWFSNRKADEDARMREEPRFRIFSAARFKKNGQPAVFPGVFSDERSAAIRKEEIYKKMYAPGSRYKPGKLIVAREGTVF